MKKLFAKRAFIAAALAGLAILGITNAALAASKLRGVSLNKTTTGADIDILRSWNVNLVYYFLDPNELGVATDETTYLANLEQSLLILDDRLAQYGARGIKVAINLYGPPGEFVTRNTPAQQRVFAEAWAQTAFINAWRAIAARYRGNTTVWGYNLLNEPAQAVVTPGLLNWNALSTQAVAAIRAIDPAVRIIIQAPYGNPDKLNSLKVIKNQGPIVYSFNFYSPRSLSHQGLYGLKLGIEYPTKKNNIATLRKLLAKGLRFGTKNKVQLYVAEFAVVRWTPNGGGARYIRDVARILESAKIDWTYHAFYGSEAEDPGDNDGNYSYPWSIVHSDDPTDRNMSSGDTDRLTVLKTLFRKNRF